MFMMMMAYPYTTHKIHHIYKHKIEHKITTINNSPTLPAHTYINSRNKIAVRIRLQVLPCFIYRLLPHAFSDIRHIS